MGRSPLSPPVRIPRDGSKRMAWWRLRSRTCAAVDMLVLAAAVVLYVVSLVDSVVSWSSDRMLITEARIGPLVAIIGGGAGLWWLASAFMVYGQDRGSTRPLVPVAVRPISRRQRLAFGLGLGLALELAGAIMVGNASAGTAKGEARILPGPRYEVSTPDLNDSRWTTISAREYRAWQARFMRMDGFMFPVLGIVFSVCELTLLRMHRTVTRTEPPQRDRR